MNYTFKVDNTGMDVQLYEMARVGMIDEYEVYIHTDDPGKIPHFHIWDYSTRGQNFHTCVRIDKPEYFHHTGKEDVLNSKMRKELVKFLTSKSKNKRFDTNWEYLISMWNDNNSDIQIDEEQEIPNYLMLK